MIPFQGRTVNLWGCIRYNPATLTWNLQITHLERKMILQTSMIMFQPLIFRDVPFFPSRSISIPPYPPHLAPPNNASLASPAKGWKPFNHSFLSSKYGYDFNQPIRYGDVDGRNPAPPGMNKTLWIIGYFPYHLVQDFFHQQYGYDFMDFEKIIQSWLLTQETYL